MSIIWVIEQPGKEQSIALSLIGDFPIRVFASLQSFKKLAQIHFKKQKQEDGPEILLVDADDIGGDISAFTNILDYYLPKVGVLFLVSKDQTLNDSRFSIIKKPIDSLKLYEIVKNLKQAQEREQKDTTQILRYKDLVLNALKFRFEVLPHGDPEHMSVKETSLLKYFMEHPGICISREDLRQEIWDNLVISPRTIDSHISRLRRRLEHSTVKIGSVYGGGYVFK